MMKSNHLQTPAASRCCQLDCHPSINQAAIFAFTPLEFELCPFFGGRRGCGLAAAGETAGQQTQTAAYQPEKRAANQEQPAGDANIVNNVHVLRTDTVWQHVGREVGTLV